jgi:hypothetical protein
MPKGIYVHKPHSEETKLKMSMVRKGKIPKFIPDNTGRRHTKETIEKLSGENGSNWKGDKAGIRAMHKWVEKNRGLAKKHLCLMCGEQANEWSNKDHKYKRILEDYHPLCWYCHAEYDKKYNLTNIRQR